MGEGNLEEQTLFLTAEPGFLQAEPTRPQESKNLFSCFFFFLSKYFVDQEKKIDEYLLLLDFLMKK